MLNIENIQPVIIGTDVNAYGVARAFHTEYGLKSKLFGSSKLLMVDHSAICNVTEVADFQKDSVMVETLMTYSKNNPEKQLVLLAASEQYVFRLLEHYDDLKDYYTIPYSTPELGLKLSDKMNFYSYCEKYGLDYPLANTVSRENHSSFSFDIEYPVILKPTESNDYFNLDFPGKEKAYIIQNENQLHKKLGAIYATDYKHDMIIQEYIPGDTTNEYVMNTYSDSNGHVKLLSLGRIAVEDPQPEMRGNYLSIISPKKTDAPKELYEKVKSFLESINFTGLANFDFKYDSRDGKFKAFEINLRQGRSSFFSVLAGANFAIPIVNELLGESDQNDLMIGEDDFLWINCHKKSIYRILKDTDPAIYNRARVMKNVGDTLTYSKDKNIVRTLKIKKYYHTVDKRLKQYS
ncbi:D-aspartate ligase [Alkalibacterium iburiense]|uniref:D-aspartate ligase n=1 Tax=Alkalibacterium iburiense TaxID=290589 RepID=A0ABP3GTC5_9LACT